MKEATMAVPKATISHPPAQHQAQPTNNKPQRHDSDHQLKSDLFEALRHLNRGYGVALAALDRLEAKDRQHPPHAFSPGLLTGYRNRTETLRALANRDLLRLLAGREEQEAERFGSLCGPPERKRSS
jgi:hypothetical protein